MWVLCADLLAVIAQVIANQDSAIIEGEYEEIEEGIHASSRYSSFLNKRKSKSWGIEETRQFYKVVLPLNDIFDNVKWLIFRFTFYFLVYVAQALQQCGTEFSVMETFFPERSRKELKLKFFRWCTARVSFVSLANKLLIVNLRCTHLYPNGYFAGRRAIIRSWSSVR